MSRTLRKKAEPAAAGGAMARDEASRGSTSPAEGWVGLTRDQFDFALQTATALLQSLEAMQKAQWAMTTLALQRHRDLQARVQQATEIQDLVALQVEMMRFDAAAAVRSAQEIYDAALRSATETLERARSTLVAGQGDGVKTWLQALQSMTHTGVRPLDDLFGQPLWRGLTIPGVSVGAAFPD